MRLYGYAVGRGCVENSFGVFNILLYVCCSHILYSEAMVDSVELNTVKTFANFAAKLQLFLQTNDIITDFNMQ